MNVIQDEKLLKSNCLELTNNTACLVVGGSSITSLSASGNIDKHSFYPKTLEEYLNGIVDTALQYGRLNKNTKGVAIIALAGAVQREGELVGLTENFRLVREDAQQQKGMHILLFRQLVEEEFAKRGYNIRVFGYNDTVPALSAIISQPNTNEVLNNFEEELGIHDKSLYSLKYMINGTGTGEASLNPDTAIITTAEKGHLKPNYLWYTINPFFKFITRFAIVGENRSIERSLAGGPAQRSVRHFSKILNEVIMVLKNKNHAEVEGLSQVLGFRNREELVKADGINGVLNIIPDETKPSVLPDLGKAIERGSQVAINIKNAFARGLGSSMAYMHFAMGEMPDTPLNTFIGPNDIRESALGFIRNDASTTALLTGKEVWETLNQSAQQYANAVLINKPNLFKVLNINEVFPNIHPDFGGLPALAESKLKNL